jgi:hypothetical protein
MILYFYIMYARVCKRKIKFRLNLRKKNEKNKENDTRIKSYTSKSEIE